MLERLSYSFGICDNALKWIESYLKDRTQRVAIGNTHSNNLRLQYGVPQGSVLGPKLYCMYSKPVGEICKRHKMSYHSYADDTQAYQVIKPEGDWNDLSERLKSCLSEIRDWMSSNMLKLNQDKTELIVFAPKHRVKHISDFKLPFDGTILSDAKCVKNLGVFLDKTLSMDQQVSAVAKSCYHQIRNIGLIRPYITENACKTLVCSLVTSRLDYGNALLYNVNSSIIARLQRVQNTAARLITRKKKFDSITPALMQLHWIPVQYRPIYKILLYVFKALHGKAPAYLEELITPYSPGRSLRSTNGNLIEQPRDIRTKTYGDRRFDRVGATLWNELPIHLRKEQSLPLFKKGLKTHIFRLAYCDT